MNEKVMMKYVMIFLMLITGVAANAQVNDSSMVVNQGDPSIDKLPVEGNNVIIEISPDKIPAVIRKALSGKQYKGWENSSLYYDQTIQLYWLELCKENRPVRYFFDKEGKSATGRKK